MQRRVQIDLDELIEAMEEHDDPEIMHYLNAATGKVTWTDREHFAAMERIFEELAVTELDDATLRSICQEQKMADWEIDMVVDASHIADGTGSRYFAIPHTETGEAYRDMQRFIQTLEDGPLADRLWEAIDGRGAFRLFRLTIGQFPELEKAWHTFRDARRRQRALDWLEEERIEPIPPDSASANHAEGAG